MRLVVFGAVALTVELTRAARLLGWVPYVVDPRQRFAVAAAFPDAEQVLAAWPREAFEQLGGPDADTAVAVLTHAPELDDERADIWRCAPRRSMSARWVHAAPRQAGASG